MAKFFRSQIEWRRWLARNHAREPELWVGFYKASTGRESITWKQSVDEALCFGWIDGLRKRIDDESYQIRFTPRRQGSSWSAVNIARVRELDALGLVHDAGRAAFAKRGDDGSAAYSYEQRHHARLDADDERRFRAHDEAWAFFRAEAPSYQKAALYWVTSAKQEATRRRRLERLIEDSAAGRRIKAFQRPRKGGV